MCAKLSQVLVEMIPGPVLKDGFKSLYYKFYYNRKHSDDNNFYISYKKGIFEYEFENGIIFKSHTNFEEELRISLKGYIDRHKIKKGEMVIDCGADLGDFTIYASKAVGDNGRVIAFEPHPVIFDKLRANIELNALANVTLIKKGVWSQDSILRFMIKENGPRSVLVDKDETEFTEIPVVSLDEELKRMGVNKIDFIKMDVEGAELEALKGASRILREQNIDLAIASYHVVDGRKSCFILEKVLSEMGYKAETAYPKHLTTYAVKNTV